MLGFVNKHKSEQILHKNHDDARVALFSINKAINDGDKKQARVLFNSALPTLEITGSFGIAASFAKQLGYAIKAAQLYELAGDNSKVPSMRDTFYQESLSIYNETGDVSDSERVEKKIEARKVKRL